MRTINLPKLILAGAGPGDKELISLKAIKALQRADVVLYDALVNPEILMHATKASLKYVGKRSGYHSYTQDEINALIIQHAFNDGVVVRLKGGDPFVFGRGMEEIEYARAFGIDTEVIPGISSVTGVPASQEIALTKRNVSESFWVLTGTTKEQKVSSDIQLAAQSTATIVILMGMGKLKEIQTIFLKQNKAELPIAIIQNGTQEEEQVVISSMGNIVEKVELYDIKAPAIIIIGEVVKHSPRWRGIYQEVFTNYNPVYEVY
ncbi:MAG: uroporphyrinogen-III C-methyltransferase [Flavobacteriales bacterium]|nr:uroporphyrinogen-III C-methyltransferase [Flavobacteriales bacterium]